jgi:uracil-DNA glycosylase
MFYPARFDGTYEGWRKAAEDLLADGRHPAQITWMNHADAQTGLPGLWEQPTPVCDDRRMVSMPAGFERLALAACYHSDPDKWNLLYSIWWRWHQGDRYLLKVEVDPEIHRLRAMERQVKKAAYRMEAFVRFRRVDTDDGERYVAWHRPDHPVLRLAAPSFVSRFRSLRWSIVTPDLSAHWDPPVLRFSAGATSELTGPEDEVTELWRTYYRAVFNPARVKVKAMQAQLPVRHWKELPEASVIAELITTAPGRVGGMLAAQQQWPGAAPFVSSERTLPHLQEAAARCQGCPLHQQATRTIFGEGPADARIVLVGEQPGDQEDLAGRAFVGPAGLMLDRALAAAGLERERLYLTNAVKHFKFVPAGKFRRHQRPSAAEVTACRPWLETELTVKPDLIICLGATAARSLLGFRAPLT